MQSLFKVYTPDFPVGQELEHILRSGQLTSGHYVRIFENQLKEYLGNPYIMVTGSNTYASLIALALCNIQNGDEVIASAMACLASNQPVLNFGGKLVWADIDPRTGTLHPDEVRKKITPKTKAILHYHWGGYPGYIDEINAIGAEYGIPVIDDAIESFGAEYKGNKLGNTGTPITTFSFQTVRLPNSVDGGAIAFADEVTYQKALRMVDFGIDRSSFRDALGEISAKSDITFLGYNAIMNELNAFIGSKVLEQTPNLIAQQRSNAKYWDIYCKSHNYTALGRPGETLPNYWIYSFLTHQQEKDLMNIRESGYYASKVHIRNDYYSCFGVLENSLKGVTEFYEKQLSVPSGWWVKYDV
jgi:dTDP-4-amino-4,6-dideoxygalactose transaminase